jgi:SAM-dependent methyltransferase
MTTHPSGWRSYDSVAETYERVAVPWFEPMADDLVAALGAAPGDRILDVGTGTGLVAALAGAALGTDGVVIGLDPSVGMLRTARDHRGVVAVVGMAPGLPFPERCFDVVAANLVLSHLPDLAAGLTDLARVLRRRGRLGATAWGPSPADAEEQGTEADAIVGSVRQACGLPGEAPVKGAPWEEVLRDGDELHRAFGRAGLHDVALTLRTYRHRFRVDEYVSGWGGLGRYLRSEAGEQRWRAFSDQAAAALHDRLGNGIVSVKQAWVATGTAG